jgi:nitroimidazol reductase NimA-like FMN-containing flavoprotein (pyridoxamine 5'-phosphate oxidase superfamily)
VLVPNAEKLHMPAGYGETTTTLDWGEVSARLAGAKQYWVVTNRRAGSPHVVPVDGLWVDDVLYYGGSPDTLHVRMALTDPHVTIHLPDPWKVVVVEGEVRLAGPTAAFAQHLADLANEKYAEYGITFDAGSYRDPFVLHPRRVLAWSSFPADATRFVFSL